MRKFLLASSMIVALAACSASASQNALASPAQIDAMDAVSVAEAMQAEPAPMALEAAPAAPAVAQRAHYEPADMSCDISARRSGDIVRLVAFAESDAPAYGEYELVFTKHDRGGDADIMQGGDFDIGSGRQELGVVETNIERGGRYSARLTLRDADGVVCQTDLRR